MIVVVSAPSGGGKGTILSKVLRTDLKLAYSVSATTRKPRIGEVEGHDYYFLSETEFLERVRKKEFVEWAKVHGNYYGTPRAELPPN